jgi:hypothetical protein
MIAELKPKDIDIYGSTKEATQPVKFSNFYDDVTEKPKVVDGSKVVVVSSSSLNAPQVPVPVSSITKLSFDASVSWADLVE